LIINCHEIIVLIKQSPAAPEFIFQQDGALAHTARSARNWLRANCPDFTSHHKGPVAFKFAEYKPNGLSCTGCNVGGLLQA